MTISHTDERARASAGEALARQFHEIYERRAPDFGYETRTETRDFDPQSPNGSLMVAVCTEVSCALAAEIVAIFAAEREEAAISRVGEWLPIESAPKDGTFILLFASRAEPPVSMGYYDEAYGAMVDTGWMIIEADTAWSAINPTHWQQLPAPPSLPGDPQ